MVQENIPPQGGLLEFFEEEGSWWGGVVSKEPNFLKEMYEPNQVHVFPKGWGFKPKQDYFVNHVTTL